MDCYSNGVARSCAPLYTEGLSTQPRLQASQRQQGANASNTRNKAPAPARSSQDPLREHEVPHLVDRIIEVTALRRVRVKVDS